MAEEEPPLSASAFVDEVGFLRANADWLFTPELGVCVVGSSALAIACARQGVDGPRPGDLDLAWALDVDAGEKLLREHGVFLATTEGNVTRGTLALKLGGRRLEITTFRGDASDAPLAQRIADDLAERDMTIGALALQLATGELHDPQQGLRDWLERRVRPVGDPAARVREHPVRWLRYFRKAHELGFDVDTSIRNLDLRPQLLLQLPREAIAGELRSMLVKCASPGRCLCELHEVGLLVVIAPELALQFDGRPAGPQRHHPEISQALHLILALEWAFAHTQHLDERDALTVRIAVLCHDLGKGYTKSADLPRHLGHDQSGLAPIGHLLDRWPGLADPRARTLARQVCALHLHLHRLSELRPGTLARLYDEWLRGGDFPAELFALAIAADAAGRLGHEHSGETIASQVLRDVQWLRTTCAGVDAAALREQHPGDLEAFRAALHEARAKALAKSRRALSAPADERPQ